MKRIHRLPSSRDFQRVVQRGKRGQSDGVLAFAAARDERGPVRVGITATRKVGGAVQRNRAKRLLREAARTALPALPEDTDVVLMARGDWSGRNFQDVTASVNAALRKAGIAC